MSDLVREYVREVLCEAMAPTVDLDAFDELETVEQMREYLDKHAQFVGEGVGRRTYDVGLGEVIKLASNSNGRGQNKKEAGISKCAAPGAPVVRVKAVHPKFLWVICVVVEPVVGDRLDQAVKATVGLKTVDDLKYAADAALHPEDADPKDIAVHERLYPANAWYTALVDTMVSCRLDAMELHADNWGLDEDGDLVLLDTGG